MAITRTYTYITDDDVSYDTYVRYGIKYHRYLADLGGYMVAYGKSGFIDGTKKEAMDDLVSKLQRMGVKIKPKQ